MVYDKNIISFQNTQSTNRGVFFIAKVYKKYKFKQVFKMINSKYACFYLIYVQKASNINTC